MQELFSQYTEFIRQTARRLIEEKAVERVIGFEPSDLPLRATPLIARTPEECDRLVWHSGCGENLASYLKGVNGKVAIVAKGCDARALVGLIQENQVKRENLRIIGVPCLGTLDFQAIGRRLAFEEILSGQETGDEIRIQSASRSLTLPRAEALCAGCLTCEYPSPLIFDTMAGEPVAPRASGCDTAAVDGIEAMPVEGRWENFARNLAGCIRCYACRNACPLCYCAECFTERTTPQWLGTTAEPADAQLYHLVRALHLGGRCIDCGACSRACPQGIDLRRLNKKLEKEAREMFKHIPGTDLSALPVMATYDENDPQDFILE